MDATTFNKGVAVCTRGTGHVAIATSPDECLVPGETSPRPFENRVETSQLKAGAPVRTTIAGEAVWTKIGELGPESDPAHEGTGGGVRSHTYRGEAKALFYSLDVLVEGNGVVRSFDRTTQNHKNTIGIVLPKSMASPELVGPFGKKLLDDCPFLRTMGNVEAPEGSFDRLRRGEAPDIAYRGMDSIDYKNGPGDEDTACMEVDAFDVTIDTRTIRLNIPRTPPSEGSELPELEALTRSLSMLPRDMLDSIGVVTVQPVPIYDDVPGSTWSTLASTRMRTITFYPRRAWPQNEVDATMIHEATHANTFDILYESADRDAWRQAIFEDGSYPSSYGTTSEYEDLSEFMVVYMLSKDTPCEELARALFPNRYRVLEEMLSRPPPGPDWEFEPIRAPEPEGPPEIELPPIDDVIFTIPEGPPPIPPPPGSPPDSEE